MFDTGRTEYYKNKRRQIEDKRRRQELVSRDALLIYHYGMSAFIELFPQAKDMEASYHDAIIAELERLKRQDRIAIIGGINLAVAANLSKEGSRAYRSYMRKMSKM